MILEFNPSTNRPEIGVHVLCRFEDGSYQVCEWDGLSYSPTLHADVFCFNSDDVIEWAYLTNTKTP